MSEPMTEYIYYCYNPTMWWFDNNGDPNLNGIGTPHHLCKIGLTKQPPKERLRGYNTSDTGMPKSYRYKLLMRVNNCAKAESRVHTYLHEKRLWCNPDAPGRGTEWFFATEDMIRNIFDNIIRHEFDGEYEEPELPNPLRMMPEDIRKIVNSKNLTTSKEYDAAMEVSGLPPTPWKDDSPYHYLASLRTPSPTITPFENFIDLLRREPNVRTPSAYSEMLLRKPEASSFPSLVNISDRYYSCFKSFNEIVDKHFPARVRR